MPKASLSQRIKEYILENIRSGAWPVDHRVPAETKLMQQFAASRMTVHRAIKELAAGGHVCRHRGRGTFVARPQPRSRLLVVSDIAEEIRNRGGSYFCRVLQLADEPPSPLTTHVFGPRSQSIARSRIVHFENGEPLQVEDRYVDLQQVPGYLRQDFTRTTTYHYLMQSAPLQKAEHALTAVLADTEQQHLLQIQATEPCFLLRRKTWSRDHLVSYAELLYPGSRYSFGGIFYPDN